MTATASDIIAGTQNNTTTPPAAPTSATPTSAAWMPAGMPQTPSAFDEQAAVAARAEIDAMKADRGFYEKLMAKDPEAMARWQSAHKVGFPPAVDAYAEQRWNENFAMLEKFVYLSPQQKADWRAGLVDSELHHEAVVRLGLMERDKGFQRRRLDGDMEANQQYVLTRQMARMQPVKR